MGIKKLEQKRREQKPVTLRCPNCGEETTEYQLKYCVICRSQFCYHCAVTGYGRDFCSDVCQKYFFHGDSDDLGEEE